MCLSSVYKKTSDESIFMLKNIADVKISGETLVFVDLMGVRTEIEGKILEIDLMENIITISAE